MSDSESLEQQIRDRAFQLWVEDGQPIGKEKEHWERARAEIEGQKDKTEAEIAPPPTGTSFGP